MIFLENVTRTSIKDAGQSASRLSVLFDKYLAREKIMKGLLIHSISGRMVFMKRLMFCSPVLLLLLFFGIQADVPRGYVTNPGIVVNASNTPVKNAYISYMSLDKRYTWSYSLADGNFGGTVGIRNITPASMPASELRVSVQGNSLSFYVTQGARATVQLLDIQGRSFGTVLNRIMDQRGYFSFSPFADSKKHFANTVYIAKVSVNGKSECIKMMNQYRVKAGQSVSQSNPGETKSLGKIAVAIDTLRVGKTEYYSTKVPISSYTESVGTVKIVKMDVTAKVDSIYALMSASDKGYCVTLGHFNMGANAGNCGLLYAGGCDGPGGSHAISTWAAWSKNQVNLARNAPQHMPTITGVDNVHGGSCIETAVILPHNCSMGNTWDPQFVEKAYRMVGCELRGAGNDWMLAPCVSVNRHDHYGRLYEGYSENPDHVAAIAKSAVLGLQTGDLGNPNAVGVCLKHFCGDGGSCDGTMAGPCNTTCPEAVTYEQLKYIHLLPYQECFKVFAISVMDQFGSWMGKTMAENTAMNVDWLRGEQHFKGFVCGDWGTSWDKFQYGLDCGMNVSDGQSSRGSATTWFTANPTAARGIQGVKGVLTTKMWMFGDWGFYNKPVDDRMSALIGCADDRAIGREAVRKCCVLVKNSNGALPLTAASKVALVGDYMNSVGLQCGGWTLSWQSLVSVPGGTSFYQGMQQVAPGAPVTLGNTAAADIVIVGIGEGPYAETAFPNIDVAGEEQCATYKGQGKKVVLVVVSGRPVDISSAVSSADAIIIAMWPGSEGEGLADLLYNKVDFTGKLAWTWPVNDAQEPINWGYPANGKAGYGTKVPQWPYGFGLNYKGDTLKAEDGMYSQVSVDSLRE
jgi:beta-glucosidase